METTRASETSANFNVTTRRYIPEDSKLAVPNVDVDILDSDTPCGLVG
jgi:hypothetical protein